MKSLTLRIYLTVVAVLLAFALVSGWMFQRQVDAQRQRADTLLADRMSAWAELIEGSLPPGHAPRAAQAQALLDWSQRLRLPLALDDAAGVRIAESELYRQRGGDAAAGVAVPLDDRRTLRVMRPWPRGPGGRPGWAGGDRPAPWSWLAPRHRGGGLELLLLLPLLFVAIAAAAWPVVRALTRRLQALRDGVERFGAGELSRRVEVGGSDEVAALATSFNQAAARIEALVGSHRQLLANASHELRSPLARMKLAAALIARSDSPAERERLKREIDRNVGELDALVDEVLLASRLEAVGRLDADEPIDLLPLVAEEAAAFDAAVGGEAALVRGDERLLRRAVRNLLQNAQRYGGGQAELQVACRDDRARLSVCDRGPGVPEALRERIFEPFYRLPGQAEEVGGVGLGLSLVRQIAAQHGGSVVCSLREGGGSCFSLSLPAAGTPSAG